MPTCRDFQRSGNDTPIYPTPRPNRKRMICCHLSECDEMPVWRWIRTSRPVLRQYHNHEPPAAKTGRVIQLDLVRGHPLLVDAAREAVMQWEYRPTLLNGQPVAVLPCGAGTRACRAGTHPGARPTIIPRLRHQPRLDRIIFNISNDPPLLLAISHPVVIRLRLPERLPRSVKDSVRFSRTRTLERTQQVAWRNAGKQ